MTKQKAKICKKVIKYKKLNIILKKAGISDYIELQKILGPGNIQFLDIEDDATEVFLSESLVEELEQRRQKMIDVWVTRILAILALVVSIIALFRPC